MSVQQLLDKDGRYIGRQVKTQTMIDNYIYLYHTKTLIALPLFPETVTDSMPANFNSTNILSRSAPIWSYSNSGPRTVQFNFQLHRDMMNDINTSVSNLNIASLADEDYVDVMIKQLQAMALPTYVVDQKMVDPPIIAVRIGKEIFCKGVVNGGVTVTYNAPVLENDKYALIDIAFTVTEVEPYDATSVSINGSYRGLTTSLDGIVWKKVEG